MRTWLWSYLISSYSRVRLFQQNSIFGKMNSNDVKMSMTEFFFKWRQDVNSSWRASSLRDASSGFICVTASIWVSWVSILMLKTCFYCSISLDKEWRWTKYMSSTLKHTWLGMRKCVFWVYHPFWAAHCFHRSSPHQTGNLHHHQNFMSFTGRRESPFVVLHDHFYFQ